MRLMRDESGLIAGLLIVFVCAFAIGSLCALLLATVMAQEKDPSYPQTRQWQVATVDPYANDGAYAAGRRDQQMRVWVIDTAGVCIYLARNESSNQDGITTSIAAVPKSRLPNGAGCQ